MAGNEDCGKAAPDTIEANKNAQKRKMKRVSHLPFEKGRHLHQGDKRTSWKNREMHL